MTFNVRCKYKGPGGSLRRGLFSGVAGRQPRARERIMKVS